MKLCSTLACLRKQRGAILLAAGFFDGVHRGHQAIIRKLVAAARREHAAAWVMTFDIHPLKVLDPETAPRILTSTPHKLQLLETLGVQGCVVLPFTGKLAGIEPEAFIAMLKKSAPALRHIIVGRNWTFGRQGGGTPELLKTMAPGMGFKVTAIAPVRWQGIVVSSTRIRAAVLSGRLDTARAMLGRPFSLLGTVVAGRGLGRKLGIPTANLNPHNEVVPPNGVYVVRARWKNADYSGIVNLGIRPTVKHVERNCRLRIADCGFSAFRSPGQRPAATGAQTGVRCSVFGPASGVRRLASGICHPAPVLELHIFGLRRNLYGHVIEVAFLKKLRRERVFPSMEALQRQVRKDIERAKQFHGLSYHRQTSRGWKHKTRLATD